MSKMYNPNEVFVCKICGKPYKAADQKTFMVTPLTNSISVWSDSGICNNCLGDTNEQ